MEVGGGGLVEVNLLTFSWRDNETPRTTGVKTALSTDKINFPLCISYVTQQRLITVQVDRVNR